MTNKYSGSNEVVEVVYGKRSVFEVVKVKEFLGTSFVVYKDGQRFKGSYSDLSRAVQTAKEQG